MTIWQFASEPPEATEAGSCPLGALDTPDAQSLILRLSEPDDGILGAPPDEYLRAVQSCTCPDPFKDMLNIDLALSLEVCRFAWQARGQRIERMDAWVASEREAHDTMKGAVR